MPQELIFPVETDGWIINRTLYGWPPMGPSKKVVGLKAKSKPIVIFYSSTTEQGLVLRTQRPARIVIDPKVREWLKFKALLSQWHEERGAMSSITEISNCPAYQAIIGMGETAITFILSQLKSEGEEPDQWFWALRAITGVFPGEECSGDYLKMAQWWLTWGAFEGYARW